MLALCSVRSSAEKSFTGSAPRHGHPPRAAPSRGRSAPGPSRSPGSDTCAPPAPAARRGSGSGTALRRRPRRRAVPSSRGCRDRVRAGPAAARGRRWSRQVAGSESTSWIIPEVFHIRSGRRVSQRPARGPATWLLRAPCSEVRLLAVRSTAPSLLTPRRLCHTSPPFRAASANISGTSGIPSGIR